MKNKDKKPKHRPSSEKANPFEKEKFAEDGHRRRKLRPMRKEKFNWQKLQDDDDIDEEE